MSRSGDVERSRTTQQQLMEAAVTVLIEFGYSGASTLKVQQRAGMSRGRLLHHYPNRDSLLVAAVQHIAEQRVAAAPDEIEWPEDPVARATAAVRAMWSTYHQGYFLAATELWVAARHNAPLAEELARRERALGDAIRASCDVMFGADLASRPRYVALRELLNTSMRGVALAYSFERHDPTSDPHLPLWTALALRELDLVTRE